MVKVHQLVAAIATTLTLFTTGAYALGLGDISWKSSYGQPLNAQIQLTDTAGLTTADIKPTLASPADFAKSGIDRSAELSKLTFTTIMGKNGKSYIQITSQNPIKEPYLNFLVNVAWKGNNISKEYSILMDFPSSATKAPVTTPTQTIPTVTKTDNTNTSPTTTNSYRTTRGDTLWSVAAKLYSQNSVAKAATAIYKNNPNAFINGNANNLLVDYTLKVPTQQQINAISITEANTFIQSTKVPTTTSTTAPKNNDSQKLESKLESSAQQLNNALQENNELNAKLENLQAEIDKLNKITQLKNTQIQQIKNKIETTTEANPATDNNTVADNKPTTDNNTVTDNKPTTDNNTVTDNKPTTDNNTVTDNKPTTDNNTVTDNKPVVNTQPINTETNNNEPSFIASLLNNTSIMIGGGVLLLLCIAIIIIRRRKANDDDDATEIDLSNVTLDDDDDQPIIASTDQATATTDNSTSHFTEGTTVLDQADIYLVYNHHNEAKELLKAALAEEPTNTEYRLKLMETYAQQGDKANFDTEQQTLVLLDPIAQNKIDDLKEKYPAMTVTNETTNSLAEPEAMVNTSQPTTTEANNDLSSSFTTPTSSVVETNVDNNSTTNELTPIQSTNQDFALDTISPTPTKTEQLLSFGVDNEPLDNKIHNEDSPVFDFSTTQEESAEDKDQTASFDLNITDDIPPLTTAKQQTTTDFTFNDDNTNQPVTSEETTDDLDDIIEKDQVTTKLELVQAYIDMQDIEGAQDLLQEIIQEGDETQQIQAHKLLASLGIANEPIKTVNDKLPSFTQEPPVQVTPIETPSATYINTKLTAPDLGFELSSEDEVATKLQLANAYIQMGDTDGAKDILNEVIKEGTEAQIKQAEQTLSTLN